MEIEYRQALYEAGADPLLIEYLKLLPQSHRYVRRVRTLVENDDVTVFRADDAFLLALWDGDVDTAVETATAVQEQYLAFLLTAQDYLQCKSDVLCDRSSVP